MDGRVKPDHDNPPISRPSTISLQIDCTLEAACILCRLEAYLRRRGAGKGERGRSVATLFRAVAVDGAIPSEPSVRPAGVRLTGRFHAPLPRRIASAYTAWRARVLRPATQRGRAGPGNERPVCADGAASGHWQIGVSPGRAGLAAQRNGGVRLLMPGWLPPSGWVAAPYAFGEAAPSIRMPCGMTATRPSRSRPG